MPLKFMQAILLYIAALLVFSSCQEQAQNAPAKAAQDPQPIPYQSSTPDIPEISDAYQGITIISKGPRGGSYHTVSGKDMGYRIFRVHIINDTTKPVELNMHFTGTPTPLNPDSKSYLHVFLIPKTMTPAYIQETYDFGVTGLPPYLDTALDSPTMLKTTIQPGKSEVLYIGVCDELNRMARSRLYICRDSISISYIPSHEKISASSCDTASLVYAIGIDPPQHYALIPCGQITYK